MVPPSLRSLAHARWLNPKTGHQDARAMRQAVADFAEEQGLMDVRWSKTPDWRALKLLGIYHPTSRDRLNQYGMDWKPRLEGRR